MQTKHKESGNGESGIKSWQSVSLKTIGMCLYLFVGVLPTSSIPEPTSVFKSFFKSSVSLEALEAEIEASKKQREAEQQKLAELSVDAQSPLPSLRPFSPPMAQVRFLL